MPIYADLVAVSTSSEHEIVDPSIEAVGELCQTSSNNGMSDLS